MTENKVSRKDAMLATMLSEAARQSCHYKRSIFLTYYDDDVIHFSFTRGADPSGVGQRGEAKIPTVWPRTSWQMQAKKILWTS